MPQIQHAAVWLDHREAKIFLIDREGYKQARVTTHLPHHQTHNKGNTIEGKRAEPDQSYYHQVVKALEPAAEWLLLGPSSARDELASHIHSHDPRLAERIVGNEASDHPSDGEIVAHARAFFRAADRMLPRQP